MQQSALCAGGYDWASVWRTMYDEERAQAERMHESHPSSDFWSAQAPRFATAARRVPQPDSFMRAILPHLRPADCVLDIGAGTGRYAPTLARAAATLLALEPSPAMRAQLEQRIQSEQLANVQVLGEPWPTAMPLPCDVALAAHVVYGVRELAPFLRQMDASARRACFLLVGYRHPAAFTEAFWERIYGVPRLRLPGALECLNVLYQLGIPAQLTLIPLTSQFTYSSEAEALADLCWRLRLPPTPQSEADIRAALYDLMDQDAEGGWHARGMPTQTALIWWEPQHTPASLS